MSIQLKKAKDVSASPFVLVWGQAGTGKTVFCLTAPEPILFIDIEKKSVEYAFRQVHSKQSTDFTIITPEDPLDLITQLQALDDEGYLDGNHFRSFILDSGTRIWSDIRTDYEEETKVSDDSLWAKNVKLAEWARIKGPLNRIMHKIRNTPMVRIVTAHESQVIDLETQRVIGFAPKMEKSILYDANIQIQTFINDRGVYCARVIRDNTGTFAPGAIVENPTYDMWGKFYESGGKNRTARTTVLNTGSKQEQDNVEEKIKACFADEKISVLLQELGIDEIAAKDAFAYYKYDIPTIRERLEKRRQLK